MSCNFLKVAMIQKAWEMRKHGNPRMFRSFRRGWFWMSENLEGLDCWTEQTTWDWCDPVHPRVPLSDAVRDRWQPGGPLLRDQCGECPIDICFSGSSCLGFTGTTWDGPIRIYTKKLSVSCCELLTRITIEVDIPPEDVLTTRNHNVEQDVETFGILFFSHQFYPLSWAENRSPHEVLRSTWSGLCSRVSRMRRGGDSLCHSQCAGDVTGRSLSVCSATLLWGVAGIADIARKSFSLPHFFPHKFHVVLCVDLSFFLELCHHVLDDMMYIIYLESIDLWWSQTY